MVNYYHKKQLKLLSFITLCSIVIIVFLINTDRLIEPVNISNKGVNISQKIIVDDELPQVHFKRQSYADYDPITNKDLFRKSRKKSVPRPKKVVIAEPIKQQTIPHAHTKRANEISQIQLIGIVSVESKKVAVFFDKMSNKKIYLKIGEKLNGWLLSSILNTKAFLTDNDQEIVKELLREKNTKDFGVNNLRPRERGGLYRK